MDEIQIPKPRNFGWELKPTTSVYWKVTKNLAGQICVVLEHSLLRGINCEMLFWWFKNFPNLEVTLKDIDGYKNTKVPAYYLWHPSDHVSAKLSGKLGPNNTSVPGANIHIVEFMQYLKYGKKYKVDQGVTIYYCEKDGWCMGKVIPLIGSLMLLRIHFKDVYEGDEIVGVHYHYEVVAGTRKKNFFTNFFNKKIKGGYSEEFWEAWITHNTIEVGVFENFLPALYEQKYNARNLVFSKDMNCMKESPSTLKGYDYQLFQERVNGFENSTDAFDFLKAIEKSYL